MGKTKLKVTEVVEKILKTSKKAHKWLDIAKEDLGVARVLFKSGRYIYCAFFCQQAVEKLFKAIIIFETEKEPPYVHDLIIRQKRQVLI